jgi:hypothetical protein
MRHPTTTLIMLMRRPCTKLCAPSRIRIIRWQGESRSARSARSARARAGADAATAELGMPWYASSVCYNCLKV